MKIHGGEKSHKCNQCKYTTYFQTNLKRHQKNHGMEKSCKCKQCDYAFKLLSTMKAHKKAHIGLRSHKCNQCENASAQANNLQTHIKAHSGKGLTNAINVNIPLIINSRKSTKTHGQTSLTVKNPSLGCVDLPPIHYIVKKKKKWRRRVKLGLCASLLMLCYGSSLELKLLCFFSQIINNHSDLSGVKTQNKLTGAGVKFIK